MNIDKAEAKALTAKILREIADMVEKSASVEGHVNQKITTFDEILSTSKSNDAAVREYKIKLKIYENGAQDENKDKDA